MRKQGKKRLVGRPAAYLTAEELEMKIDKYFQSPPDKRTIVTKDGQVIEIPVLTITGLVLYLGFCSRQSFYDLENQKKFSYTIKRARTLIEGEYEKLLQSGLGAGAIFALKNFGWVDRQEIEHSGVLTLAEAIKKAHKEDKDGKEED